MTRAVTRRRVPRAVTSARILLGVVSAYHLFIPAFTLTHLDTLRQDIAASTAGISATAVQHDAATALILALAVHIPLFVVTGFLAIALSSGHPWALRPATMTQVFGIAFSTISTPPFDSLRPLIPVFIVIGVAIIVLLWAPRASRVFFRAHPRSRASRREATRQETPVAS